MHGDSMEEENENNKIPKSLYELINTQTNNAFLVVCMDVFLFIICIRSKMVVLRSIPQNCDPYKIEWHLLY